MFINIIYDKFYIQRNILLILNLNIFLIGCRFYLCVKENPDHKYFFNFPFISMLNIPCLKYYNKTGRMYFLNITRLDLGNTFSIFDKPYNYRLLPLNNRHLLRNSVLPKYSLLRGFNIPPYLEI